jgi:hypothetical protein
MSIANFLRAAKALPEDSSMLLKADHGLGKSQVVRQLRTMLKADFAEELGEFEFIDRRLSQMSEGDMIGLPSTDGDVTRFNPPYWFMRACRKPCFVFLDELNRATPEVMQAAFQIVLDRELNGHKLHPLSRVASAVNTGASYSVNEIDPALGDRFFVVDLVPTVADWLKWSRAECIIETSKKFGKVNCHPVVTDFIQGNQKWLDTPQDADPARCHPSRRSWERVSDTLQHAGIAETPEDKLFYLLTMGYVGVEAAIAFRDFAKNYDNQISGKEILQGYHTKKVKAKVKRQGQEALNTCIDKVADHLSKCDTLDDRQGKNLRDFMNDLPGELRIACWGKLTRDGIEKIELAKAIHKWCAEGMLKVFGVPMGEAGIGVVPDIPGIFKKEK